MKHETRKQLTRAVAKPLLIQVVTDELRVSLSGRIERKSESYKTIDYNNASDRKWLSTHCFWAMRNNRQITTYPVIVSTPESL